MRTLLSISLGLALASCTSTAVEPLPQPPATTEGTLILDQGAADRLLGAKGVTLQWISWDRRGAVNARMSGDTILLTASQNASNGPGSLYLDGRVTEIGSDYFIFYGTIRMTDTPDAGRNCEMDKSWRFAITQNRPYWRLREFEWCDGLTDYIDVYW